MTHETQTGEAQATFEATRLRNEINAAHAEALHNVKLGTSLADKAVKLIQSGDTERTFVSPRLDFGFADPKTTSLVLNSELRDRGIDATAVVSQELTGTSDDPSYDNVLSLKKVDGKKVA